MNVNTASVAAYERVKHLDDRKTHTRSFNLILMSLFFVLFLVALAVGAYVYSTVVATQTAGTELRVQTGILSSVVQAHDGTGAVEVRSGPEGPALVLTENLETTSYETRIYLYNGWVCEEYSIPDRPFTPERATPLYETSTFDVTFNNGVIHVQTDVGELDLAVRSEQGGGA